MANGNVRVLGPNSASRRRGTGSLLAFVLALGLVAAVHAQPFPSFLLDTTRHIGRDLRVSGCYVALAASRTGGAVVWGRRAWRGRASRLTRSMDIVDTIPLDVTGPWNDFSSAPAVACSDSGYAVAWDGSGGLWLALVSEADELVNRVRLDTEVQVHSLAVAARSDRYVVVYDGWFPSSQSQDVRAIEVALGGTILRRSLVARGESPTPFVSSSVVARGDSAYFAVFRGPYASRESCDINARFILSDGASGDTGMIPIRRGACAFGPKVAFDGEDFWVAWLEETTPDAETVAKVARVTQSGVVLDTGGIVVQCGVTSIVLAAARETTLVALGIPGDTIVGMRYDAEAQVLDTTPVLLSIHGGRPVAAVAADTFLAVWFDKVEGVSGRIWRLVGRRLTASGTVVDPDVRDYAFSANNHRKEYVVDAPIIASDGENFLTVWCDERAEPDYSARLLGRRFDNQGQFLDAEPFTIADPSPTPLRPVLTYGAGCYFLCWFKGSVASYAVRISPQGEVMDTVPIALPSSTGFAAFDATFLRDSMFVILGGDTMTTLPEVVRVMADGRVLDSVPRILKVRWGPYMSNRYPSIASIGDTLVMACRIDSGIAQRLWLAVGLYEPSLKQYDSVWWDPKPDYLWPHRTSVACGGGRILVASDVAYRESSPYLWLLDSAGQVLLDSMSLPNPYVYGNNFCIGYDGANFMCVKSGEGFTVLPGYRVSRDGDLLDNRSVQWAAFDSTLVTGHSGLARDTLGNVGLVFFTFESEGYMTDRIRAAVFPRMTSGVGSPRQFADLNGLRVSPNPSTGMVWLMLAASAKEPQTIAVRDIAGRVRTEVSLSPASADRGRAMLDLRQLPAGVYFLETAGERRSCKLVLARPGGVP